MAMINGSTVPAISSDDLQKAREKYLRKVGHPTKYNAKIAAELLARYETKEPLTSICKDSHMPAVATVYDWERCIPEFAENLARARRAKAETLVETSHQVLVEAEAKDMQTVRLAEARAKHYLELGRVRDPSRFGNQVRVNHDVVVESMADRLKRLKGGIVDIPAEFSHIIED